MWRSLDFHKPFTDHPTDKDGEECKYWEVELWKDLLPKRKTEDVTLVSSSVVLLPGLLDNPHKKNNQRAFHNIVENCDASVFDIEVIKMTVDFKWDFNVRKIVLAHLAGYSVCLVVASIAMVRGRARPR